jgi:hypothetical protein
VNFTKLFIFLESRKTAIISLIVMTVLTLYMTSMDNRISTGDDGVFFLLTSLNKDIFADTVHKWGLHGIVIFNKYLRIDIFFALSYMIALPSVMALMFSQYALLSSKTNGTPLSKSQYRKRNIFVLLPFFAAIFNIVSDSLLLQYFNLDSIPSLVVLLSGLFQITKMALLIIALIYVVYLLMIRRKMIRAVK